MANAQHSAPPALLVPRYVANLNRLAELQGMTVRPYVEEYVDAPGRFALSVDWLGTRAQFFALGLITSHQRWPIERMPSGRREFCYPQDAGFAACPILRGHAEVEGESIKVELLFCDAPRRLSMIGDVEVIDCNDEVGYHGNAEALVATKVCTKKELPTGVRAKRTTYARGMDRFPQVACRRQPDGLFLIWRETEIAVARRVSEHEAHEVERETAARDARAQREDYDPAFYAELTALLEKYRGSPPVKRAERPSYLRLAVDNTRNDDGGAS
jgi:hypothetical protein